MSPSRIEEARLNFQGSDKEFIGMINLATRKSISDGRFTKRVRRRWNEERESARRRILLLGGSELLEEIECSYS